MNASALFSCHVPVQEIRKNKQKIALILFPPLFFLCLFSQNALAQCSFSGELIKHGAWGVAESTGSPDKGCELDTMFPPASVIKIATVLAALQILGPDYRFTTEFFLDGANNLYIRGFGDPSLVSEEIALITVRLHHLGLKQVNLLYIDSSAFALERQVPGREQSDNPYDAPIGPTVVNFNTASIYKDKHGNISSGEVQTPTLPLMHQLAAKRPSGHMLINICADGAEEDTRMARFTAEIFRAKLQGAGISVRGIGGTRKVPSQLPLFHSHKSSKTLAEISSDLLHSSSNFMANLVFLQSGAASYGFPATWEKGKMATQRELTRLLGNKAAKEIHMIEGSGLSRNNRISARALLALLEHFSPYKGMLRLKNGLPIKSGTLSGVYNYAGYLDNGRPFVILLSQMKNTRDELLEKLRKQYGGKR